MNMERKSSGIFQFHSTIKMVPILLLIIATLIGLQCATATKITIDMPDIRPDHSEQYLCKAYRLPASRDGHYIVGFNPIGDAKKVHHMLMYGCQLPGIFQRDSPNFVWDCSEMHVSDSSDQPVTFEQGPVCRMSQHILYGWALDAPALKLPDGVGFKVGGADSNINFLVLQVHYGHTHVFDQLPELTDNSGLTLDIIENDGTSGITKQAGVLLLISLGKVQVGKSRHEIWCDIDDDDIVIHPFRYRVHTHKLGTRVLGAKVRRKGSLESSKETDLIIGDGDPQKPQMFYPVKETNMTITKGDSVYAYCEFENNNTHVVNIGQTGKDEMCNFYLMYWTESPKLLSKGECFGHNPRGIFSGIWQNYNING